jgi:hypothetical protein
MAIINSYAAGTVTTSDLILGVDTSNSKNTTKTFTAGAIAGLASGATLFTTGSKTLTPTEVLSLNTAGTALELLPAPGAGKILVVDSFIFKLTFNTAAYNFTNGTGGQDNSLVIGLLVRDNAAGAGLKWQNGLSLAALNYTQTFTGGGIFSGLSFAISPSGSLPENTAFSIATRYDNTTVTQGDSNVIFSFVYRTIDSTTLL